LGIESADANGYVKSPYAFQTFLLLGLKSIFCGSINKVLDRFDRTFPIFQGESRHIRAICRLRYAYATDRFPTYWWIKWM
jgi:hypothetical protein